MYVTITSIKLRFRNIFLQLLALYISVMVEITKVDFIYGPQLCSC
jgi:hypothetical protein